MILEILDRPIAFHRCFVTLTGSVTAAVLLSQAVYWSRRTAAGNCGWFWKTGAEWEEETGLTRYEQESARKILRSLGFWEEQKRGIPARLWFRLDLDQLERGLNFLQTSMRKTSKQVSEKPADCEAENQQTISETTKETTTPPPMGGSLLSAFEEILPSERGGHGLLPLLQLAKNLGATPEQIRGFPEWAAVNVLPWKSGPTKRFFLVKDYLSDYLQEAAHGAPVHTRENHSNTPRSAGARRESGQQRVAREFARKQAELDERIRAAEASERLASANPADTPSEQPAALLG